MLSRRPVEPASDRVPPEIEMHVVLERDADSSVELYALVQQLGAVVADERLGDTRFDRGSIGMRNTKNNGIRSFWYVEGAAFPER